MPGWLWAVIVVAALIIIGVVAASALRARRSRELQGRFGPEYDRVAADAPSKRQAEAELKARAERHDEFDLRPLDPSDRDAYRARWQDVQAKFVDDPDGAVAGRRRADPGRDAPARVSGRRLRHPRGRSLGRPSRRGRELPRRPRRSPSRASAARRAPTSCAARSSTTGRCSTRWSSRPRPGGGTVVTEERIQTGDLVTDDADAPIARRAAGLERERLEPLFDPAASRSCASGGTGCQASSSTSRGTR